MSDWCILRCSAASTLRLASSLVELGIGAWTPIEIIVREKLDPKRLLATKKVEIPTPLIPQIVFADFNSAAHLAELSRAPALVYRVWDAEQRRMVAKGYPPFTLFRRDNKFSSVPDAELDHLRKVEQRRKPRGDVRIFKVGDRVKLTSGSYAGLRGIVVSTKGKQAEVEFPEFGFTYSAKVPMWLLLDESGGVHVTSSPTEQASSAKAA